MKTKTSKKTLRLGTYSFALCIAVLAVVIILNLLIGALPTTLTKFDVSGDGLYDLSAETEKICAELDRDITMYLVSTRGKEDQRIQTLLEKYVALSARLQLRTVDPSDDPTFLKQFDETVSESSSVLLVSGDRHRLVNYSDIYTYSDEDLYNYQYYGTQPTEVQFFGESAITGAIDYLTNDDLPVVYYLTGHGEGIDMQSALQSRMTKENLALHELNLLQKDGVPEDAACVLIGVPTLDFAEDEITMLQEYIAQGGSVFLISYLTYHTAQKLPNLYAFTEGMGLHAEDGLLCEADNNRFYMTNYYLLPELNASSTAASALASSSINVLLQEAQGLRETESHPGYTVASILQTSDKAYIRSLGSGEEKISIVQQEGDLSGKFMVAAESNAEEGNGHLFWYTTPTILSTSASGNLELFLSNIVAVCGKTASVTAGEARSIATEYLTVNNAQATLWGAIVVVAVPLVALIAGLAVYINRRRK